MFILSNARSVLLGELSGIAECTYYQMHRGVMCDYSVSIYNGCMGELCGITGCSYYQIHGRMICGCLVFLLSLMHGQVICDCLVFIRKLYGL